MKVSEFCPNDCVRIKYDEPWVHEGCRYTEAVVMPTPFSAITTFGRDIRVVTVVGIIGDNYIIEEIMTNGQTSRGEVSRDRVKRS